MKKQKEILVCSLLAAFFIMFYTLQAEAAQDFKYLETRGEKVRTRNFAVRQKASGVAVSSSVEGDHFLIHCSGSGDTREWRVDKEDTGMRAVRDGEYINITGTYEGKKVDRRLHADGLPWLQSLYYSLGRFAQSGKEQIEFWMIRPDNLSLVKLRAEKESVEKININGKQEAAQKIRLGLTGLLSYVWHGFYWYRQSDGVLLQYKDMKALPGRSKLTLRLCRAEGR